MLGKPEFDAFITRSFTAIVSTVRGSGTPASSMVSYARLDDAIYFSTTLDRLKGKSLVRDPRLALCVINDHEPNAYVTVEGSVIIHRDNPTALHERMYAYWQGFVDSHPAGPWSLFGRANLEKMWAAPGRAIFEVHATRVSGYLM